MARRNLFFFLLLIILQGVSTAQAQANFPQVSEAIQITKNGKEQNSGEQKIYLMDMKTGEVKLLGSYAEPKEYSEKGQWRCDIHSRWSPKGDMIGINSTRTGERQAYIYRVKK